MRRQLLPAVGMLIVFTVLTGLIYPLTVTGFAQAFFHDRANGSLVEEAGRVVGSRLIGQSFSDPAYFHPRPSAAGAGYDASASSGSNLGPTNTTLLADIERRAQDYRQENGLPEDAEVPVDAVTASSSGLDPHISVANARLQARRVAQARRLDISRVMGMIDENTEGRGLGFLGEAGVNVLTLNVSLDRLAG